ncbi:HAD family hydrolase [Mariniblastus fucicola]|uniref:Alpha-D-glucose-1-phosphate phosphatase YihX n=1 Tax=Mariniblastus fucicola TaxID=980251 RepID=A0A5B9PBK7_9BACT|nr:HAD family phosphatase [Mariniblastus fucicola]QEG22390.1 Alpha-D-glucose-1-phosphate phosphatase YihX [Mariniblastus fucicola]
MTSDIKFIFFDMGKVLLEFDHQRLIDQVAALAKKPGDEVEQILFQSPHDLENRFERGELNGDQFHRAFCEVADCEVGKDDLMLAVADIFWLNTSIVHVLTQLSYVNFPMAILSNTCEAHWDFAVRHFAAVGQMFRQRVLSYEEKSMKPDGKIYQAAIALAKEITGCEPGEIFFTDDRQENVDAARQAGMHAELYVSTRELAEQLRQRGVPVTG